MRKHSGPGGLTIPWNNASGEYPEASKITKAHAGRKGLSLYSFYEPTIQQMILTVTRAAAVVPTWAILRCLQPPPSQSVSHSNC